jgi:hypothetical protein
MFDCYQNIAIIYPEVNKKGEMWRFFSGWSHPVKACRFSHPTQCSVISSEGTSSPEYREIGLAGVILSAKGSAIVARQERMRYRESGNQTTSRHLIRRKLS